MKFRIGILCLLCLLISIVITLAETRTEAGGQGSTRVQGVNLIVEPGQSYTDIFHTLHLLGANTVSLVVLCEQRGNLLDCSQAPSDVELSQHIRSARAESLAVWLKPHIETKEFSWRGEIRFDDRTSEGWWEDYRAMVNRFSRLRPDAFVIGTELVGLSDATVWRDLIQIARWNCPDCQITYAAHFEEFEQITFWDALDVVAVDAYFPLDADSDVDALRDAWKPYRTQLADMAHQTGKPVIFSEVGYQARVDAQRSPWQTDEAVRDARGQAFAYQAVFETFQYDAWWGGALWWDWNDRTDDGTGFTPTENPSEGVLLAQWRKSSR